jgi:hypothetical protein
MHTLKDPKFYHSKLIQLRKENIYAKNWNARLESKTNRHPNTDGTPWGWYEVFPFSEAVGYWSGSEKEKQDDLKGVDVDKFNKQLSSLDQEK